MSRRSIVSALRSETDKHVLRILDLKGGDREFTWDDSGGGVAVAEREFNSAVQKGMQGYQSKGEVDELTKNFDPLADTIVVAPRVNGG